MAIQLKNVVHLIQHPKQLASQLAAEVRNLFRPTEPWLSTGAIDFSSNVLSRSSIVLEWGSGRSTLWFAKRAGRIVSVEHHPGWFETVKQKVDLQGLSNVDLRLVPLDHPESEPSTAYYEKTPN